MTARRVATRDQPDGFASAVKSLLEIVVAAIFLVTFVVQPSRIPSESMVPTLRVGDFLLLDKQAYAKQAFAHSGALDRLLPPSGVKRGDLVVFHYPVDPTLLLVKRVVGLPGDRIRLRDGRLLIDGEAVAEPYAFYSDARPNGFRDNFPSLREADPNVDPPWWLEMRRANRPGQAAQSGQQGQSNLPGQAGDMTVPPNSYFVLGDNRNDSEDSRYWGFVPAGLLVGRPLLVYFTLQPPDEAQGPMLTRLRHALQRGAHSWRILQ